MKSDTSSSWSRIDKQTFWHNISFFAHDTYVFPAIAFEYPSKWKFNCCGEMDHASQHLFCSESTANSAKDGTVMKDVEELCGKKYMAITVYALFGCPSGKWDCGIEQTISKTVTQKYDDEVNAILANSGAVMRPKTRLRTLEVDAVVYEKNDGSRNYLINLDGNIIVIAFFLSEEVDDEFISEFFSRMTWDRT